MAIQQIYQNISNLTGGVNSTYLDYADGNSLSEGDRAYGIVSDTFYLYRLNATSGAAESSPNVIAPDTNAGTKRWILITAYSLTSVTTSVTAADNTATTAIATTAFAKSQDAVLKREPDQSVNMTAAASGSSGITVADNDNIDFGTGNFTLVWKGSLPDWTPGGGRQLLQKGSSPGFIHYINSSNQLEIYINGTSYAGASVAALADGSVHEITTVVVPGTSITNYLDGVLFGSAIAYAGTSTVNNAIALHILGYQAEASRTAGTCIHAYTLNFAPTVAEVLDMYRNGIPESWKWGSQTSLIIGNDSTFAGASNWANVDVNAYDETTGGVLTLTASAANQYCTLPVTNATTVANKKYRLEFDVPTLTATWIIKDFGGTVTIGTISATGTGQKIEFTASTTGGLRLVSVATTSAGTFDNFLLYEIGATLALTPDSIRRDKWYDCSSNNLDASYPATGWTLTRKADTGLFQPVPTAETTAVTLTIAKLLTGIITATHTVGATQAYTLPTGALIDAWPAFNIGDSFDWSLINLSAAALDTVTVTADTGHTIVGNPIVQSAHSSTGGVYGNSSLWRTKKTAASVFVSYRLS